MTGQELQDAINACIAEGGGRVFVDPLTPKIMLVEPLVFPADPRPQIPVLTPVVELVGTGIAATTIYTLDPDIDLLHIARSNVRVSGMLLQGGQGVGAGRGVVISDPVNGSVIHGVRLSDVYIAATGREALLIPDGWPHLLGQPSYDQISVGCSYDRVTLDSNQGGDLAYIGKWNTLHRFTQCRFTNFKGRALYLNGADTTSLRDCAIENGDNTKPWVECVGAVATLLDHVYMEDHRPNGTLAVFNKHDKASTGWDDPHCTYRRRA
jgi:hypothetical protein